MQCFALSINFSKYLTQEECLLLFHSSLEYDWPTYSMQCFDMEICCFSQRRIWMININIGLHRVILHSLILHQVTLTWVYNYSIAHFTLYTSGIIQSFYITVHHTTICVCIGHQRCSPFWTQLTTEYNAFPRDEQDATLKQHTPHLKQQ